MRAFLPRPQSLWNSENAWLTTQSRANPKRQNKRAVKGTVELIDQAFAEEIDIVDNGVSRRIYVFEAILLQICSKELAGHKRATAVRLLYQDFIESQSGKREPEFIIEHIPAALQRGGAKSD